MPLSPGAFQRSRFTSKGIGFFLDLHVLPWAPTLIFSKERLPESIRVLSAIDPLEFSKRGSLSCRLYGCSAKSPPHCAIRICVSNNVSMKGTRILCSHHNTGTGT